MPSEREKALSRDAAARARLVDDPIHLIKQRRGPQEKPVSDAGWDAHHRGEILELSRSELAVLTLAADGRSNRAIGAALFKTEHTVKTQMRSVLKRLQARDRAHAVAIAIRSGLID